MTYGLAYRIQIQCTIPAHSDRKPGFIKAAAVLEHLPVIGRDIFTARHVHDYEFYEGAKVAHQVATSLRWLLRNASLTVVGRYLDLGFPQVVRVGSVDHRGGDLGVKTTAEAALQRE